MSCINEDILGQTFQDAFEILQQHQPITALHYPPVFASQGEWEKCPSFIDSEAPFIATLDLGPMAPADSSVEHWRDPPNCLAEVSSAHYLHNIMGSKVTRSALAEQKGLKGRRKKLRLFEYLHESLREPCMSHCIQWVDQSNGVFQFISKYKETLAELWGRRKGNRKLMTYQKMARALRNYSRTGEILKVRRKLTYQFNAAILRRLASGKETEGCQCFQQDSECYAMDNWGSDGSYVCHVDDEPQSGWK